MFVQATYPNESSARAAVDKLLEQHIAPRSVTLKVRSGARTRSVPLNYKTRALTSALGGGVAGALLGAIVAASGLLGFLEQDGWSLAMRGLFLGAIGGTLVGAVRGVGWWRMEPDFTQSHADVSGVQVGVVTEEGSVPAVKRVMAESGGTAIQALPQAPESMPQGHIPAEGPTPATTSSGSVDKTKQTPKAMDAVHEAGLESFPASDPPGNY